MTTIDCNNHNCLTAQLAKHRLPNPFMSISTASSKPCGVRATRFVLDEDLFMEQIGPLPIFLNSPCRF